MHVSLKNTLRPTSVATFLMLAVAVVVGVVTPVMVNLMDGKLSKLAAIPAVLLLGFLLLFDRKLMMLLIVLLRASGDLFLSQTRFNLGGAALGVGGLINAAVILIALLMIIEKPKAVPAYAYFAWLPFLLLALGEVYFAPAKGDALRYWLTQVSFFAMFVCAYHFVKTREDFIYCVKLVLWSSLFPILYCVVDIGLNHAHNNNGDGFRLQSTFGHPNILAFYVTLLISLAFYMLKNLPSGNVPGRGGNTANYYRVFYTLYILVLLGALVLTKTRSAWIACLTGFLLYGIFFERRYLVYLLVGGVLATMLPEVRDRLGDLFQGNHVGGYAQLNSFAWRVYLWKSGLNWMQPSHYLFGYGLSNFQALSQQFFPLAGPMKWGAHSVYVQWIFELGVVGFLAYLWTYARILVQLRHMIKFDKLAAFWLIVVVINFLICAASDNMIDYLSFNWYLWFIVGAGCAVVRVDPASNESAARH